MWINSSLFFDATQDDYSSDNVPILVHIIYAVESIGRGLVKRRRPYPEDEPQVSY